MEYRWSRGTGSDSRRRDKIVDGGWLTTWVTRWLCGGPDVPREAMVINVRLHTRWDHIEVAANDKRMLGVTPDPVQKLSGRPLLVAADVAIEYVQMYETH